MRAIVKTLREGRLLLLPARHGLRLRDAIFLPFFGVPAATVTALPRLAQARARDGGARPSTRQLGRRLRGRRLSALGGLSQRRRRGGRAAHERVHRGARARDARAVLLGAQALQDAPAGRALALSAKMTPMRLKFAKMQGQGNDFVVIDGVRQAVVADARAGARHRRPAFRRRLRPAAAGRAGPRARATISATASGTPTAARSSSAATARAASRDSCATRASPTRTSSASRPRAASSARASRLGAGDRRHGRRRASRPREVPFAAPDRSVPPTRSRSGGATIEVSVLSMGNPHAVQVVADVDSAPVATQGPLIENHPAFPEPRERGLHAGARARPHPPARLGARRRRDARLRHGRLRGRGRRHPSRPARSRGPRDDTRRRPRDPLGRRERRT